MNKFDTTPQYPIYSRVINYIYSWLPRLRNYDYNNDSSIPTLNPSSSFENIDRLDNLENNIAKNNYYNHAQSQTTNHNSDNSDYRTLKL